MALNLERPIKAKRFGADFQLDEETRKVLVVPASTTVAGKIRIATVGQAQTGELSNAAITPASLKAVLDNFTGGGGASVVGVDHFDTYTEYLYLLMSDNTTVGLDMKSLISYYRNSLDKYVTGYYGYDFYTDSIMLQMSDSNQVYIPMTDVINAVKNSIPLADNDFAGLIRTAGSSAGSAMNQFENSTAVTPAGLYNAYQQGIVDLNLIVALDATSGTVSPDFYLHRNYSWTLQGNRVMANPAAVVEGRSGSIFLKQDATGSRTLAFGTAYKAAGGISNLPTLSTAPNAVDRLDYIAIDMTNVQISITKGIQA